MDQYIAEGGDAPPVYFSVLRPGGIGEPLGGFSQRLQVPQHGILKRVGRNESLASVRRILLDTPNTLLDVTQVDSVILHTATAS
jgi:hypothetical protein